MRGRLFNVIGAIGAMGFGVFSAYTTLQPALEEQQQTKDGVFAGQHPDVRDRDTAISQAIKSDFREAKEELVNVQKGGFAWGIRQMLFGGPSSSQDRTVHSGNEDEHPRAG